MQILPGVLNAPIVYGCTGGPINHIWARSASGDCSTQSRCNFSPCARILPFMKESDKGDIGVALVTADLIAKSFEILLPVSAITPYDLVAHRSGKFYRVQVKYRRNTHGFLNIDLRKNIGGATKVKRSGTIVSDVEIIAIYCPDTNKVYYLDPNTIKNKRIVHLRFPTTGKFRVNRTVRWAEDCLSLDFLEN